MPKLGRVVVIIPVKGNSERVPMKNVRPFANTNLLKLKLEQMKELRGVSDIVVSSEDDSVLKTAEQYGVRAHKRDPYYSTSQVPMSEVYSYLARQFDHDSVMWVNVVNPLATANLYQKGLDTYGSMPEQFDCVLSVSPLQEYVIYNGKPVNFQRNPWPRSQDLTGMAKLNFVVNVMSRENLQTWGSLVGENPYYLPIDPIDGWDIDYMTDFEFCEFVYLKRRNAEHVSKNYTANLQNN